MSATITIEKLLNEAKHCRNIARLWQIRDKLVEYGAWDAAGEVEAMATTLERAQAVEA